MTTLTARERVLGLLEGRKVDRIACYSGMGNATVAGLKKFNYKFSSVHGDARMMADAAASSYHLFGYECAVVPFDLCVEAGALGCEMNPYEDVDQLLYPTIKAKVVHSEEEMPTFPIPEDLENKGRVPVVAEAIRMLKQEVGSEIAVGTYVLGPFTLAGQIMDLNDLFKLAFKKQALVNAMLDRLADVIIRIAKVYKAAGADYVCVREMGATTDILSPRIFKAVIQPHLRKIFANIGKPSILHICGGTNKVIGAMSDCGASAISVENKNDQADTRAKIGWEPLVFGNIDAYNMLVNGSEEEVRQATRQAIEQGVDALWPSCDIWPTAPVANLRVMVETVKEFGARGWVRQRTTGLSPEAAGKF